MTIRTTAIVATLALLLAFPATGAAQFQGGMGAQGGFGQGGMGQGQGGFGQGGYGQGGYGQGGFGQGGMGQGQGQGSASGSRQAAGGLADSDITGLRSSSGQERFDTGGFVGRDAEDVRNSFDSLSTREAARNSAQEIENLNETRRSQRRNNQNQESTPPPIRVRLLPVFDYVRPTPAVVKADVESRLTELFQARGMVQPGVLHADGRVTLRGVVRTERDRELAEAMASIEPGVSEVENLLELESESTDDLVLPNPTR